MLIYTCARLAPPTPPARSPPGNQCSPLDTCGPIGERRRTPGARQTIVQPGTLLHCKTIPPARLNHHNAPQLSSLRIWLVSFHLFSQAMCIFKFLKRIALLIFNREFFIMLEYCSSWVMDVFLSLLSSVANLSIFRFIIMDNNACSPIRVLPKKKKNL